jgi:hypothetical protein
VASPAVLKITIHTLDVVAVVLVIVLYLLIKVWRRI